MIVVAGVLAVFIGMAVGLLGGGGSILTTPLLIYVVGFDAKQAIAASLFVVGVTSIFGLISHARAGRVVWRIGLIFGGAGMVGAFIGGQIGALALPLCAVLLLDCQREGLEHLSVNILPENRPALTLARSLGAEGTGHGGIGQGGGVSQMEIAIAEALDSLRAETDVPGLAAVFAQFDASAAA